MIKIGSKVVIKEFQNAVIEKLANDLPPLMIVEGLYSKVVLDMTDINLPKDHIKGGGDVKVAKCLWYNTKDELQSEYIRLELLQDL